MNEKITSLKPIITLKAIAQKEKKDYILIF